MIWYVVVHVFDLVSWCLVIIGKGIGRVCGVIIVVAIDHDRFYSYHSTCK